ncbi:nitroreductase [Erwinia amylovora Ea644]|nr:nitroreductase [Erwinia amylovora Ea644]CCP07571.1 nitroreductase [Erwinia amylovora MR1]
MNEITQRLKSHRSTRSYSDKPVPEEVMDDVIEAAWRAPTSVNSHQVSLVVVRDVQTRARIAELAGGQAWITQAPVGMTAVLDRYESQQGIAAEGKNRLSIEVVKA